MPTLYVEHKGQVLPALDFAPATQPKGGRGAQVLLAPEKGKPPVWVALSAVKVHSTFVPPYQRDYDERARRSVVE